MIPRHYRVWLQSADGLIGPKSIIRVPGNFKPSYRTAIFRQLQWILHENAEPKPASFECMTRTYTYWKQEGRKLWYREVVE